MVIPISDSLNLFLDLIRDLSFVIKIAFNPWPLIVFVGCHLLPQVLFLCVYFKACEFVCIFFFALEYFALRLVICYVWWLVASLLTIPSSVLSLASLSSSLWLNNLNRVLASLIDWISHRFIFRELIVTCKLIIYLGRVIQLWSEWIR